MLKTKTHHQNNHYEVDLLGKTHTIIVMDKNNRQLQTQEEIRRPNGSFPLSEKEDLIDTVKLAGLLDNNKKYSIKKFI